MRNTGTRTTAVVPVVAGLALVLAACGGGSDTTAEVAMAPEQAPAAAVAAADRGATASGAAGQAADTGAMAPQTAPGGAEAPAAARASAAQDAPAAGSALVRAAGAPAPSAGGSSAKVSGKSAGKDSGKRAATNRDADRSAAGVKAKATSAEGITAIDTAEQRAANQRIYEQRAGATDTGVTRTGIKLGTVTMHGMALGNVLAGPLVRGIQATLASVNDRGGILGRRLSLVDCDDGPGEVSRTKACIKKLVGQDKVFSLISISSWGSASVHEDLKENNLPAIGTWAYSQTEWQDPYMFPTHMSMIHEAMANAHWAKNVIKPRTYGLICLTSPEMQLACNEARKIMDASGSEMVKKIDVSISESSLSAQILSMRSAAPEHIIHYVINPATMAKWMVESAQQNYYPPKGISGNHLAAEVLGSLFGKHPVDRYWTNTTYKLWGPEFMATMNTYARGNTGINHHIVQASYVGVQVFEKAAKSVGPNLTRERLMRQLGNGDVYAADASLDQRFAWNDSERRGEDWSHEFGQGREFMYKYTSTNTVSNPDGSPNGFEPDPDQFVIYTHR